MRVLLVDGTNIVMRYAHAMLPDVMSGPRRGPTHDEVAKVLAAVEKAIRECAVVAGATHTIVCTDSAIESWRKSIYPEYKASRKTITGIWSNRIFLYLSPRGWLCLRYPGEEADDVIATLVRRVGLAAKTCAVLSGDSDLLALSSIWCDVYQFGRGDEPRFVKRDEAWITARFGVSSRHLAVYKALVGEPGDDLPGVRGIGPKKALKILATTTEPAAIRMVVNASEFDLALRLATLNVDVAINPIEPARCAIPEVPE